MHGVDDIGRSVFVQRVNHLHLPIAEAAPIHDECAFLVRARERRLGIVDYQFRFRRGDAMLIDMIDVPVIPAVFGSLRAMI